MLFSIYHIFIIGVLWTNVHAKEKEVILKSPVVTNFGDWGHWDNCSNNGLVSSFQLLVEPQHTVDDTGLNAVRFFCGPAPANESDQWENVTSKIGPFGFWGYTFNCTNSYAVGFELESQPYQGSRRDDTAADNFKLICQDGTVLEGFNDNGNKFKGAYYTGPQLCPDGYGLCGIQTQVEKYQSVADDTALNNLKAKCCSVNKVNAQTESPILIVSTSTTSAPENVEETTTAATSSAPSTTQQAENPSP